MLSRARTPWRPLLGVLLVVLGVFCAGPATALAGPAGATAPAAAVPAVTVPVAPPAAADDVPLAQEPDGHGVPGCGKGGRQDADHVPGTPARSGAAYELLPALYDAHAAPGAWGVDQAVLATAPGRAPPALDPPSPIDLSILRV
ncbi:MULTISPECIES: hypothetical protein [Streptomyces]|uniref:hypothetical protein n=1 Tax=Streptomyces TaxID=1883 RepID=UPI0006EB56C2|nr:MULTISPECIES: hypothetical protein [Streptomyces]